MSIDPLFEQMLGLPEFEILNFEQDRYDMVFLLEVKDIPDVCPRCGLYMPTLTIQKTRMQEIRDLNILGKCVTLVVRRRYYRCGDCNSMFAEHLQCLEGRARMTTRLREHLALKARYMPFVDIENEYQISDTTIRKIFLDEVSRLPPFSELKTPEVLGVDEICLAKDNYHRKQAWAVLADGDENTVMELLQDRSKVSVAGLLQSLQNPEAVKVVTMDMWSGYRAAVHETLPGAMVVVDKFHVVRMANDALDSVRRSITRLGPYTLKKNRAVFLMREDRLSEKGLAARDEWLEEYPNLKAAYELKESFFRMYDCNTRAEAERYYQDWTRSIPKELPGFRMICSTVRRSRQEIFNYFDAPYTNAFVEGLNRAIRVIADQGCGYDFEVLRGKVLFTACRKKGIYNWDA
jgi:transposase